MMGSMRRAALLAVSVALVASSCSSNGDNAGLNADGPRPDCTVVTTAISPEKFSLLSDLARSFNSRNENVDGKCVYVDIGERSNKSSGLAADLLSGDWNDTRDGPKPVLWSPAASTWGAVVNQRLATAGAEPIAPDDAKAFMTTPLVIAMPKPMAEALGWPRTPIGWSDLVALSTGTEGWAKFGRPEWGAFKLGKTNPNFSTSGLSALIGQAYASTGKTSGLSLEDLADPQVVAASQTVENAVVHYGETTLTFLRSWYDADRRGTGLRYVSALAVEEKSVIDFNRGIPDGKLDPGEEARPPRTPLVALYPKEGTIYSDNPLFVLNGSWVTETQKAAARRFIDFIMEAGNQQRVLETGFRPGNPEVALGDPISAQYGLDPAQPQTLLEVPDPKVMIGLLDAWGRQRKSARVMFLLDVSGSMGDGAGGGSRDTKLDLAKQAVIDSLDAFKPEDEVGVRIFSTGLEGGRNWVDVAPIAPIGSTRESLRRTVDALYPVKGTPLYEATLNAHEDLPGGDPNRITAVIVLSDGMNDDGEQTDDDQQRRELVKALRDGADAESQSGARVFTIAYGNEADLDVLKEIAEASTAKAYDATNATRIKDVLAQVVSNF